MQTNKTNKTISKDSSIYNYRLIKKVRLSPAFHLAYPGLAVAFVLIMMMIGGGTSAIPAMLMAYIGLQVLHALILYLLVSSRYQVLKKHWVVQTSWPWVGVFPNKYVGYDKYKKAQMHLLMIGGLLIAAVSIWLTPQLVVELLFFHIWLCFARFFPLMMAPSKGSGFFIKFDPRTVSYYQS